MKESTKILGILLLVFSLGLAASLLFLPHGLQKYAHYALATIFLGLPNLMFFFDLPSSNKRDGKPLFKESKDPSGRIIQHTYVIPIYSRIFLLILCWSMSAVLLVGSITVLLHDVFPPPWGIWMILLMGVAGVWLAVVGVYMLTVRISIGPDVLIQSWALGFKGVAIEDIIELGFNLKGRIGTNYLLIKTRKKKFKIMQDFPYFPNHYTESMAAEIRGNPKFKGKRTTYYQSQTVTEN